MKSFCMRSITLIVLCLQFLIANFDVESEDHIDIMREREGRYAMVPDENDIALFKFSTNSGIIIKNIHFFLINSIYLSVLFLLYTRENRKNPQKLKIDVETIKSSNFKSDRKTRFVIHGWQSDGSSNINSICRDALMKRADVNVIVVDWGIGAGTWKYRKARY